MSNFSGQRTATIYGAALTIAGGILAGSVSLAAASEWGYEGIPTKQEVNAQPTGTASEEPVPQLKAQPAKAIRPAAGTASSAPRQASPPAAAVSKAAIKKPAAAAAPVKTLPAPPKSTQVQAMPHGLPTASAAGPRYADAAKERRQAVLIAWLEMYESATPGQLTDDQITRIKEFYGGLLDKSDPRAVAVLAFWPKLRVYLERNPDQHENYSSLIYALLRARTKPGAVTAGGALQAETDLISELLGPVRIACQGSPPLTEDAVDAYADMACFLYEQKNPGKTIDAMENRAMFSNVIMQKYKDAPRPEDRAAMSNFPVGWAKFKVLWVTADEAGRKALLSKLTSEGMQNTAQTPSDPMLAQVLKNWPL